LLAEADGWDERVWRIGMGVELNCFPRGCGSIDTLSVGIPVGARGVDFCCVFFLFLEICFVDFGAFWFVRTHTGEVCITEPLEW